MQILCVTYITSFVIVGMYILRALISRLCEWYMSTCDMTVQNLTHWCNLYILTCWTEAIVVGFEWRAILWIRKGIRFELNDLYCDGSHLQPRGKIVARKRVRLVTASALGTSHGYTLPVEYYLWLGGHLQIDVAEGIDNRLGAQGYTWKVCVVWWRGCDTGTYSFWGKKVNSFSKALISIFYTINHSQSFSKQFCFHLAKMQWYLGLRNDADLTAPFSFLLPDRKLFDHLPHSPWMRASPHHVHGQRSLLRSPSHPTLWTDAPRLLLFPVPTGHTHAVP